MRTRAVVVASISCLLFLASCGEEATSTDGAPAGGIRGVVTSGPLCPVVVQGSPCPDRPWQGLVRVSTTDGAAVGEVETDARGRFELAADPGTYEVVPAVEPSRPPTASAVTVTVPATGWAEVELLVDTGIR